MPRFDFTDEQRQKLRYKSQTDLWFLCNDVLDAFKGDRFSEVPHKSMCEFYVVKDPSFSKFREFARAYAGPHDRIMLVPRQSRKSGIKIIDNVQWIINWPEIRIMTCTATSDLATSFINQLADYFVVKGKPERNPETNRLEGTEAETLFQNLFPENCITETEANAGEYITPMRYDKGSNYGVSVATAGTLSMDSSTSGWRCDVLDFDDPVSDRNSETGSLLEKLDNRIAMITELIYRGGFRHTMATRYDPEDPYGKVIEDHGIESIYGDVERDGLKYMCRPVWWLKDQPYQQPNYNAGCPAEEELDFFYPDGLSYKELKKKFKKRKVFFSQQLNDPISASEKPFTEEILRNCIVDHSAVPKQGVTYASWDLAWSTKIVSDYTVGIIGMLDDRREWWITNIIRGHFDFSERCFQIVNSTKMFRPKQSCVEDVSSSRDVMTETLWRMSKNMNVELNIDWVGLGRGTDDAKYVRMCGVHPWVRERRIHFVNTIDCMDDLLKEFRNVGNKKARNDIPDAISRLVERFSGAPTASVLPQTMSEHFREIRESEFDRLIFGKGKYTPGGDWDQGLWNANAPRSEEPQEQRFVDGMTGLPSPYPL